jgi:hypothetical protein
MHLATHLFFQASKAPTGKILWHQALAASTNGPPKAYRGNTFPDLALLEVRAMVPTTQTAPEAGAACSSDDGCETCLRRFVDELHRVAKGLNGLGGIIGDLDPELFFERHNQFNRIQAVGAKVVDERSVFDDFVLFDAQMLDDNLLNAICDVAHINSSQSYRVFARLVSGPD